MVESINDTNSILAPLMYMDYASGNTLTASDMSAKQWELFYKCWRHNTEEIAGKTWQATRGWSMPSRVVSQGPAWVTAKSIMRGLDRVKPNETTAIV